MQRLSITPRPHWKLKAREYGFNFHTLQGEPYWQEDAYYSFTLDQIEQDIEAPTVELHQMCLHAVNQVVSSERLMQQFCIPQAHWNLIAESWRRQDPSLYSRLDLAYTGHGPAKLLENNADTPTSLYETGFWQWLWLEEQMQAGLLPAGADQFNLLQEKLIERFRHLKSLYPNTLLHLSCCKDSNEDRGTVQYLADCALEAGIANDFVYIEDIGLGETGRFSDLNNGEIEWLFKLYPWEFMLRETFAEHIAASKTQWLEPPWKAIVSNKALLPLLWALFPNHPNLLPAFFEHDPKAQFAGKYVKKPIFAREGANISIVQGDTALLSSDGPYGEEGFVLQGYTPLPEFNGRHALVGSWLVDGEACGLSIREDSSPITQNLSAYLPHIIAP
ncbi:MAG: glutathionylspermidine synthase family protein [Marinagarivorans sp.]